MDAEKPGEDVDAAELAAADARLIDLDRRLSRAGFSGRGLMLRPADIAVLASVGLFESLGSAKARAMDRLLTSAKTARAARARETRAAPSDQAAIALDRVLNALGRPLKRN